jgi:tripeptide aminopeptidase
VSPLGPPERRYLNDTFAELCAIASPSRGERACAERVRAELQSLGVSVEEDDAGARIGGECGNLIARLPAAGIGSSAALGAPDTAHAGAAHAGADAAAPASDRGSVLLCAHLDTVPLTAPVEPVLVDGGWENANEAILGADNKAAVAMLLALARHVAREGAPLDVELLFTVGEEISLAGSRELDVARLRSRTGYVFDHATPIGGVVVASPTHYRLEATFRGASAHAGIRPEQGRSAILAAARAVAGMRLGRIDEDTTANIGTIIGGTALNVVPEECSLVGEVRSQRDSVAEALVQEFVDRINTAANDPECDCDVDVRVQRTFTGYQLPGTSPAVRAAEGALRSCGYQPELISSGGASDANVLIAAGLPTVNVANGTERNHEPGERVSVQALEDMLDVTLALLGEVAAC